tara:strand:- start:487 stop:2250 length:1764 start_codon:yes stop_codon:yes gene_type:complete
MTVPPIIPANTAIQTFRDNGYKNTASAISELIDNSIDAKAKNIQILVFEKTVTKSNRPQKQISQIIVLDDGNGMNENDLKTSLQFGNGTKLDADKGIGKFGIGLPNASVSQCKKVEVYTWQKNKSLYTYLDIDEVKENKQQNINDVEEKNLPEKIREEIKLKDSGTAIVWSNCDRLDIARGDTLYRRMSKKLCRVFRHYLDKNSKFKQKINISYKVVEGDFEEELVPNDPMYLSVPNNLPGYEDEAVMELKTNDDDAREGKIELTFLNPKTNNYENSNVYFRFSFIKDDVWKKETDQTSAFQIHLKRNSGISFVRDGREIDFGNFGYFTTYELRDRYWGCEIRFDPILDTVFGVSNDKQGVRNIGPITPEVRKDDGITDEDVESTPNLKLRVEITKRFNEFRKLYMARLKKNAEGQRSESKRSPSIAARIFKQRNVVTRSKVLAETKTQEQIEEEIRNKYIKIAESEGRKLTETQLKKLVEQNKKLEVNIDFNSWLGSNFFSTEVVGKTAIVNINQEHKFYTKLYQSLAEELDKTNIEIVDFMLMALARAEDELSATTVDIKTFVAIKEKWGQILTELLEEQDKTIN